MNCRTLSMSLLLSMISISCVRDEDSQNKAGITSQDNPSAFNVPQLNYNDFKLNSSGFLGEKPWGDDFWSLKNAGIAYQWILDQTQVDAVRAKLSENPKANREELVGPRFQLKMGEDHNTHIQNRLAQTTELLRTQGTQPLNTLHLSPVEKYDAVYARQGMAQPLAMTSHELDFYQTWFDSTKGDEEQLGWMGYCDGWSISSLAFNTPKHAVMAKNAETGVETFFSEGDIRALFTKAASEDSNGITGEYQQIGRRCTKEDDVLVTENGRILDGQLGSWDFDKNTWSKQSEVKVLDYKMIWSDGLGREVLDYAVIQLAGDSSQESYRIVNQVDESTGEKTIYNDDLYFVRSYRYLKSGKLSTRESDLGAYMVFNKHCKDVNPASFHSLLVDAYGGSEKSGFVMDVDRNFQVWNHPVYGYEAKVGELTELSDKDPYFSYRAPGTVYLADVYLKLSYGIEVQPEIKFAAEEDNLHAKVYHFTLEFDAQKNVIGGEWGHLPEYSEDMAEKELPEPKSGDDLYSSLGLEASNTDLTYFTPIPDNIWRYTGDVDFGEPMDEAQPAFDKRFLDFLRDCSQNEGQNLEPYSIQQLVEYEAEDGSSEFALEEVNGEVSHCNWQP